MKKRLFTFFITAAGFSPLQSVAQCTVDIVATTSCRGVPALLNVQSGFMPAFIEWRRDGILVRVDSVRYPASGLLIAGGNGTGNGANATYRPAGIFVDSNSNLYTCEVGYHKVTRRSHGEVNGVIVAGTNTTATSAALNRLAWPMNCQLDTAGYLYVADQDNNRIIRFPPGSANGTNGTVIAGGNGSGSTLNRFNRSIDFDWDSQGNLYVADRDNYRILKFPPNSTSATMGVLVAGGNGNGAALNQFRPIGIDVDAAGNIFIADITNFRILKFPPGSTGTTTGTVVAGNNGLGPQLNQFSWPRDVFVDKLGYIYVVDGDDAPARNPRVLRFPPNSTSDTMGTLIAGGNGVGSALNQFDGPTNIFVTDSGHVYVSDYDIHRVLKFTAGISDTFTAFSAGTYQATLYGFNGCIASDTVTVYASDGPVVTPGPDPLVCAGDTVAALVYTNPLESPDQYSIAWDLTAQAAGFAAMNNRNLLPGSVAMKIPADAAPAIYNGMLTMSNSSISCAGTAIPFSVTVAPLPTAAITASGPIGICSGDDTLLAAVSGTGYDYEWKEGQQIVGTGINYTAETDGDFYVVVTDNNGCKNSSPILPVRLHNRPDVSITPGDVAICSGDFVILRIVAPDTGLDYRWREGNDLLSAAAGFIEVTAPGSYSVTASLHNVRNCTDTSEPVLVTVHPLPEPLVVWDGEVFHADTGYTDYQWYRSMQLLTGATSREYQPDARGNYWVAATDINGCTGTSIPYYLDDNMLEIIAINPEEVQIYPNPAATTVYITAPQSVQVILYHMDGRALLRRHGADPVLDITGMPAGLYMVLVATADGYVIRKEKLLKQP